ncbi:MAG: hypothetical protein K6E41_04975 [Solobacterium sp.]|nr:hypothetical protein [Solobacterium sp.]
MIHANDIEKGMYLRINGKVYEVLEEEMITPGNEVSFIDVKLKNIFNRGILTRTLNPLEVLEEVYIDTIEAAYLGEDDGFRCFRSIQSGNEIRVKNSVAGSGMRFVRTGTIVIVRTCDGRAFGVDIPDFLELAVTEIRKAKDEQYCTAVLETGARTAAPSFIKEGDRIVVDTRTGAFLYRNDKESIDKKR